MTDYADIAYPSVGVAVYNSIDDLPLTNLTAGTKVLVKGTSGGSDILYFSNGTGWYQILKLEA